MDNNITIPAAQASLQVCRYCGDLLHIQGRCDEPVNRSYGMATNITVPKAFWGWFDGQNKNVASLASGEVKYVNGIAFREEDDVYILVAGTPLNHEGGALLRVSADTNEELTTFVERATVEPEPETDAVLVGNGVATNGVLV